MCHDLAWQILRAQAGDREAGREAFADNMAKRWRSICSQAAHPLIAMRSRSVAIGDADGSAIRHRPGAFPPTADIDRFARQRSGQRGDGGFGGAGALRSVAAAHGLSLAELPGDLFHELLLGWRNFGAIAGPTP